MYPRTWVGTGRAAVVMGSGESVSYEELEERSNRLVHLLRQRGLGRGDVVAVLLENNAHVHEVTWAARRSGMYFTPINRQLTGTEVEYIVTNSGAKAIVTSHTLAEAAGALTPEVAPALQVRLMMGGTIEGWESYEEATAGQPSEPVEDEEEGDLLQYSSGTTGRPKGIQRPLSGKPINLEGDPTVMFLRAVGFAEGGVYLNPAPLYHTAPMVWTMGVHRLGGTVVVMERFDPEQALALIERHRVTHAQFVPSMFVRMLKLPQEVRDRYDLSSLQTVVHAAAPCPVEVKERMIEWFGPIISEYYGATEAMGATFITAPEWLTHKGSVGKPLMGIPHVLDEAGQELPVGEPGQLWFEGGVPFDYLDDPAKTAATRNDRGWVGVGDVGYLDEDGYLYLTDRVSNMIISGGVNIYPQETEDLLLTHPKVMDAAVIGVPDADLGEVVKAVVQPVDWNEAGPALEAELMAFCQSRLARYKCPRSVDFDQQLPRLESGKLLKRLLRDRYREAPVPQEAR
ncbi:acyl-CoA synthetase [Trujillonella humicola]|uniref:acyl-CoA synthetase n=1 Tax=Trujillonella humicola TaxID=3383699 RepID=UPI003905B78C